MNIKIQWPTGQEEIEETNLSGYPELWVVLMKIVVMEELLKLSDRPELLVMKQTDIFLRDTTKNPQVLQEDQFHNF